MAFVRPIVFINKHESGKNYIIVLDYSFPKSGHEGTQVGYLSFYAHIVSNGNWLLVSLGKEEIILAEAATGGVL